MIHEKNDLHFAFEINCKNLLYGFTYGDGMFSYDSEWGCYCYPQIQSAFVIFCKGYEAAQKGV